MEGVLAIIFIFGSIPAIVLYITWRRSRERMEMINRGMNPLLYNQARVPKVGSGDLKFGMIACAIGFALGISATVIQRYYDRDMMTFAVVFTLVGASVILFWWFTRKERERAQVIYEKQLQRLADQYMDESLKQPVGGVSDVTSH